MCDLSPIRNWLIAIITAITGALALVIVAAVLQGSWWTAWAARFPMAGVAALAGSAAVMCGLAISALNAYCACTGAKCAGACTNMRNTLTAAGIVLGIQAAAAATAAIVGGSSVTMIIITGALLIELALIISALAFLGSLSGCMMPMPKPPQMGPIGG
jgi:hypothetical protein